MVLVKVMKKTNEYSGTIIDVQEVGDLWRKQDYCLYTLYKNDKLYYINAYDASASVMELGKFASDSEAMAAAQEHIDSVYEEVLELERKETF